MKYRNRAVNAYKSASEPVEKQAPSHNELIDTDEMKNSNNTTQKKSEEKTGFLKLTGEKADYSKIARFLLLLGRDEAVKVIRHLSPGEVEKISREISETGRVDKIEAEELLREFGFDKEREAVRARGGTVAASEILTKAFGKEKSEEYLRKAVPSQVEGPFSFLNDLHFDQLIHLLKEESVQVLALVLRYLDKEITSKVISSVDKRVASDILKRIARGGSVSNEVIQGMEESLKEKILNQGKVDTVEIDGPSSLAAILKYMDIKEEQKILDTLGEDDADLSRYVREKLFTIDTVLHIDRNDLSIMLNELGEREIVMILRIADEDVRKKIRSSLSTGRLMLIDEEDAILGKVKRSEAEGHLRDFLELLRQKEEEGTLVIMREEEAYL